MSKTSGYKETLQLCIGTSSKAEVDLGYHHLFLPFLRSFIRYLHKWGEYAFLKRF